MPFSSCIPISNQTGQPLHAFGRQLGFAVAWHDFTADEEMNWAESFRPNTLEICLNLTGTAEIAAGSRRLELMPHSAGFYHQRTPRLRARRCAQERHQFYTISFSSDFLARHLDANADSLNPRVQNLLRGRAVSIVSDAFTLTPEQQQLAFSLRKPPVIEAARPLWYQAKALEIAATLLYAPTASDELFCHRYKRLSRERTQRVIALLNENLASPPTLEEIGRRVGCSQFHLSRIFSQEMGCGIFQYLRRLRLVRAAELLRKGEMNVTEVALAVGYSTPSHFSAAFHDAFGCCPGLYPLKTLSGLKT